eukprot:GHVL01004104.1.p2 GENE.GHVL01004104.1~~GHVL01004104.1.p2  ORF type:complete len:269 (+),score=37.80 GHVL01004104.1:21-827(+)
MSQVDQMRECLYVGNYSRTLSLIGGELEKSSPEALSLALRAHLCLGELKRVQEFAQTEESHLAKYLIKDTTALVCEGTLTGLIKHIREGELQDALQSISNRPGASSSLEMQAYKAQILLLLNRIDLSEAALAVLHKMDEDAALSRVVSCWINICKGNPQESFLTFCDLNSAFGGSDDVGSEGTAEMLIGKAVSNMQRLEWESALIDLETVITLQPMNKTALANLVAVYENLKQPIKADETFELLKSICPNHRLVEKEESLTRAFNRLL